MSPPASQQPGVVAPVAARTLQRAKPAPGSLLTAVADDPESLVYVVLNVGDGDTQLLLLPPDSNDGQRRLVVVDVATSAKLPALLDDLHAAGVIDVPGSPGQIRLLVATHPHFDHIGGMSQLIDLYGGPAGAIEQFWDPGFYFPNPSFHNLMGRLETSPWIRRLQPTSGTTMYLDSVRLTVIGPGVGLRSRFDTYGVGVNDASITLMVDYPATRVYAEADPEAPDRQNRRRAPKASRRLLLGADAQFTSWAQATVDFPDLQQHYNPVLARELRAACGTDHLRADVFKLSHHASKNGVNIELLHRVDAGMTLVSSSAGGGRYNFPHLLAMEAAREARQPTTNRRAARRTDHELGIHVTGSTATTGEPLGSMAVLVPAAPRSPLQLFRLMDAPAQRIDLAAARQVSL
jgi:beta-lactamase superfamily II metal-dependent hydrolase